MNTTTILSVACLCFIFVYDSTSLSPSIPPKHIVDCNVCKELLYIGAINIDYRHMRMKDQPIHAEEMKASLDSALQHTQWTKSYEFEYSEGSNDWKLELLPETKTDKKRNEWHDTLLLEGAQRVLKSKGQDMANYLTGYVGNGEKAAAYIEEMHSTICSSICKLDGSFGSTMTNDETWDESSESGIDDGGEHMWKEVGL